MMSGFKDKKVRLIVVGDGPLRGDLEQQAREVGAADRVVFTGFVGDEDKRNLLAASDLYVSTSQHEGFGLVFLEGMAAGLPVICYDFGGQTDFLEEGITGSLVPLNDQVKFMAACCDYLNSPDARAAAGDENLRRVGSFYIDNCARRYESLFEHVVEQGLSR